MKYKKAQDILPQYMIDDLQQYIEGGYLYIPKKKKIKNLGEKIQIPKKSWISEIKKSQKNVEMGKVFKI